MPYLALDWNGNTVVKLFRRDCMRTLRSRSSLAAGWFVVLTLFADRAALALPGEGSLPPSEPSSPCWSLKAQLLAADGTIRALPREHLDETLSEATTDACREAVEGNSAPDLTGPMMQVLRKGRSPVGPDPTFLTAETALCVLRPQVPWAISWMATLAAQRAVPACLAGLAESSDPTATRFVDGQLEHLLLHEDDVTQVDPFVLEAADRSARLRARLNERLPEMYRARPDLYRALWKLVCVSEGGAPPPRDPTSCADLRPDEERWEKQEQLRRNVIVSGLVLAATGAVIAGGITQRYNDGGLALATGSAALGAGLAAGTFVGWLVSRQGDPGGTEHAAGLLAAKYYGTFAGLVAGTAAGIISYEALKGSSSGRAATTAVGAGVAALCTIRLTWE